MHIQRSISVVAVAVFVSTLVPVHVDGANLKGSKSAMLSTESNNTEPIQYTPEDWNREYLEFMQFMNGTEYFAKKVAAYKLEEGEGRMLQKAVPALPALVTRRCTTGMGRSVITMESDGWFTKNSNTAGSWSFSDSDYNVRFNVQNTGCAGGTTSVPLQNAWAYIWFKIDCAVTFTVRVNGKVGTESQLTDYLNVFIDGRWVYQASGTDTNAQCAMANPMVQREIGAPISLRRGQHDLAIQFASNAAKFHNNAFYEIELVFS